MLDLILANVVHERGAREHPRSVDGANVTSPENIRDVGGERREAAAIHRQNERKASDEELIAELIIPETDTPGAKAARVNEFIDVMLTDWFTDEERASFRKGLAELDGDETPFIERETAEQVAILERAGEAALAEQEERATSRSPVATSDSPAAQPFFSVMKWLTLWGYYTSEIGMDQELGHVVFPGSYEGCVSIRNIGRNIGRNIEV